MLIIPSKIRHWQANTALANDTVHIWQIATTPITDKALSYLKTLLSIDERQRAERYVFAHDQQRFILARGMLRLLLSHYLQLAPSEIQFVTNVYGKPHLNPNSSTLEFNISHSHEWILLAFSKAIPVGIDIEFIRTDIAIDAIAQRFFSPSEAATLIQLQNTDKTNAFFNLWAKKEAVIKMLGTGLFQPLDQTDVSTNANHTLYELSPSEGYVGALCTQTKVHQLQYLIITEPLS